MASCSMFVGPEIEEYLKQYEMNAYKFNLLQTSHEGRQQERDMFLKLFLKKNPGYADHEICIVDCRKLGDPNDPKMISKVNEFSKTIIQQIDVLSSISTAFSNFADLPTQKNEKIDLVKTIKLALEIFNDKKWIYIIQDSRV